MKVIFLEDVPNVARAGDIKEVASGYGRNFLIPKKLAILAKPEFINTVQAQLEVKARQRVETEAELLEMANSLDGREVFLEAKTGGKDKLYGSITAADIAAEIKNAIGLDVDKRKIELDDSIRQVGSYDVTIKLGKDIEPKIKVVVSEKAA